MENIFTRQAWMIVDPRQAKTKSIVPKLALEVIRRCDRFWTQFWHGSACPDMTCDPLVKAIFEACGLDRIGDYGGRAKVWLWNWEPARLAQLYTEGQCSSHWPLWSGAFATFVLEENNTGDPPQGWVMPDGELGGIWALPEKWSTARGILGDAACLASIFPTLDFVAHIFDCNELAYTAPDKESGPGRHVASIHVREGGAQVIERQLGDVDAFVEAFKQEVMAPIWAKYNNQPRRDFSLGYRDFAKRRPLTIDQITSAFAEHLARVRDAAAAPQAD